MADRDIRVDLKLVDAQAKSALRDLQTELANTEEGVEQVESAGRLMARALEAAATDLESELQRAEQAAEALGQALGPELANRLGNSGVDTLVADLRRLGLTFDDIETDADQLAASVRRLDDVGSTNVRGLSVKTKELGDNIGKAGDATRSFVGNAVGELPAAAGAFGPLSEAVSQVTEGVLEGSIGLKAFIATGAGMGAIALVAQAIAGHFADVAKTKAFRREQVDNYTDALREAGDAAQNVADSLRQAEKIEVTTPFGDIVNITGDLAKYGVTVDEWTAAVQGGETAVTDLNARLVALGATEDERFRIIGGLVTAQGDYAKATEEAAAQTAVFGEAQDAAAESVTSVNDAMGVAATVQDAMSSALDAATLAQQQAKDAIDAVTAAAEEQAAATEELRRQQYDLVASSNDLTLASLGVQDQYAALEERMWAHAELQQQGSTNTRDLAASERELQADLLRTSDSLFAASEKYAEQQGAVAGSNDAIRAQIDYLTLSREQFPALRDQIDKYIRDLNAIPNEISTRIRVTGPTFTVGGDAIGVRSGPRHVGGRVQPGRQYDTLIGEGLAMDGPLSPAGRVVPRERMGGSAGAGVVVHAPLVVQGSIHGVDELHKLLDERDRRLAQQVRVGARYRET